MTNIISFDYAIKYLLKQGIDIKTISLATGITLIEIEALKARHS